MPDWNQIVQLNAAKVLNSAFRVLGNLADAEDVSQEVFAEAFRKWESSPVQQWTGILRRMAVCRAIDLLRSKKSFDPLTEEVVDHVGVDPVENAIASELEQRLRKAICCLSERESQVFCLMYFEHQSSKSISQSLDISPGAVATALSKARTKLELVFRELTT